MPSGSSSVSRRSSFISTRASEAHCHDPGPSLPEPLAETIAAAIRRILADSTLLRKADELGFTLIGADPAEARRCVAAGVARYTQMVAEAGIRPEWNTRLKGLARRRG
ncbi:hypothetical protein [Belnapia rosea]|uniref:Uncharacterized protein n=1 Tax=Belnapia rosea TaxID=938405 RepID=A0A1G6P2M2_9PROT|nr:hypothetical protein [Belnapia rosea]SDC74309.1 hypothetical protein SAMN04487779_1002245 [Belnapia rosea]